MAAAATHAGALPPRRDRVVASAGLRRRSTRRRRRPRAAFEGLLRYFDGAAVAQPSAVTFLLDEFLDVRTFESFPGLRHVQRELVDSPRREPGAFRAGLALHVARSSTAARRIRRDSRSIHLAAARRGRSAGDGAPVRRRTPGLGRRRLRRPWRRCRAAARRPSTCCSAWLASTGPVTDPVAALAALFSPDGALTARYRECYEFRLHRARGYGALKAILGVLAESEPLNLTEISQHLQRTPGSTKDYLSWLEDVDLITSHGKRYTFEDPLLRLYVRLYGRAVPPTDDEIVREVGRVREGTAAAADASAGGRRRRDWPTVAGNHRDRLDIEHRRILAIWIENRTETIAALRSTQPVLFDRTTVRTPSRAACCSASFFDRPTARPRTSPATTHLDVEALAVIRALGGGEPVVRQAVTVGLQPFLQRGLPVFRERRVSGLVAAGRDERTEAGGDELARGVDAAVEIDGRDERFEPVRENRVLVPSAGLLFAASKQHVPAEIDVLRQPARATRPRRCRPSPSTCSLRRASGTARRACPQSRTRARRRRETPATRCR